MVLTFFYFIELFESPKILKIRFLRFQQLIPQTSVTRQPQVQSLPTWVLLESLSNTPQVKVFL